MLIGEYTHTIDEKNRMSLPVKFRKEMGKVVVLAPGLDKSIMMTTVLEWKKIGEKLGESSMLATDNRRFNRFLLGGAVEVEVDGSGRILIPEFLKDRAGIKNKAAVIGIQNRVEIWNEKTWNDYKRSVDNEADQLAEKLGGLGVM